MGVRLRGSFASTLLAVVLRGGALVGSTISGVRAAGGRVVFHNNYRPRLWEDVETARHQTLQIWRRCDVALPSLDDEMALFGDATEAQVLNRLASAGVTFGALKCGERGPRSLDAASATLNVAPVTDVVDTTAAGDSFNAGFLAGYMLDEPITACMQRGHDLSCRVIRHPGAIMARDS